MEDINYLRIRWDGCQALPYLGILIIFQIFGMRLLLIRWIWLNLGVVGDISFGNRDGEAIQSEREERESISTVGIFPTDGDLVVK